MKTFLFFVLFLGLISQSCKKDSTRNIIKNHRQSTGSSANDILSNKKYESLTVEIQYIAGFKPTQQALDNLLSLISQRCNKNKGIKFVYSEIPALGNTSYSIEQVIDIEDNNRSEFTSRKNLAIYFLFLDGPSSYDQGASKVLGQAYYNTSMVIYQKTITDLTGGVGEPEQFKLETTVINHELGHILGLVNLGTTMKYAHQDVEHGAHCDNQDCLMNWEAETGNAVSNLFGSTPIPTFDQNCILDLQGNGGK